MKLASEGSLMLAECTRVLSSVLDVGPDLPSSLKKKDEIK